MFVLSLVMRKKDCLCGEEEEEEEEASIELSGLLIPLLFIVSGTIIKRKL